MLEFEMSLKDEVRTLSGNKRRFFLLRIADLDTKAALKICGVVRATYSSWLQNTEFVELYRKRAKYAADYKQEAIQLLRRDNQLEAVLLEGKIIAKMRDELAGGETGEGSLLRSNLAKEVYSKLISDLDVIPQAPILSWQQRIQQIFASPPPDQITQGEFRDAQFETDSIPQTEPSEGNFIEEGKQTSDTTEKQV